MQYDRNLTSRTYFDYPTVNQASIGIKNKKKNVGMIGMYETELKRANPGLASIKYDIADLFRYMDRFYDISCLM